MPRGTWALPGGVPAAQPGQGAQSGAAVTILGEGGMEEGAPSHPPPFTRCFHIPLHLLVSLCCH